MSEDQKKKIEKQLLNIDIGVRHKIHSTDFRDYMLGFIFYKYLSEKIEIRANKIINDNGETFLFKDIKETSIQSRSYIRTIKEETFKELGYFFKPFELFSQLANRSSKKFVLEEIQHIFLNMECREDFDNLFRELNLYSSKLGQTSADRVEVVSTMLYHLNKIDFNIEKSTTAILDEDYEYLVEQVIDRGKVSESIIS